MNTIICNTLTGAVSEYTSFAFHAVTPTHAGSATGLFAFGSDLDIDQPIVSDVRTAKRLLSSTLKKHMELVYFAMQGSGTSELTEFGNAGQWIYPFPVRSSGESRAVPGRGIRENYLGFGYRNPAGDAFRIDRIEVLTNESKNRRV